MSFTAESTVKIMHSQPRKIPSGIVTVSTLSVHNSSPAVRSQRCPDCIRNPANICNIMRKTLAWRTAFPAVIVSFFPPRLQLVLYIPVTRPSLREWHGRRLVVQPFLLSWLRSGPSLSRGTRTPAQRANAMVMANDRCIKWSWAFNGRWRSDAAAGNRGTSAGGGGHSSCLPAKQPACSPMAYWAFPTCRLRFSTTVDYCKSRPRLGTQTQTDTVANKHTHPVSVSMSLDGAS